MSKQTVNQLTWMQADYIEYDDKQKHTFVFTHGPIVGHNGDGTHDDRDTPFVEWVNEVDMTVEAVFCGHTHQDFIFTGVIPSEINDPDFISKDEARSFQIYNYLDDVAIHIETSSTTKLYSE